MEMINRNTAAQNEQTKKWRQELGLPDPEPTELELLLQKWEQASVAPQSPEPEGEEPSLPEPRGVEQPLPEPRGEELPLPEPRGEEPPLPEPRGEEPLLPEPRGEEGRSILPPQPRPPPLQSSSALLSPVPQPLLLDTLPVFLDLPVLDLEPRSLQHWPQLCPWFPAPLSPSTQTSLGCCQTSLLLPLFAASLPLGDRTSLHRFPGEDLGPLRHPPSTVSGIKRSCLFTSVLLQSQRQRAEHRPRYPDMETWLCNPDRHDSDPGSEAKPPMALLAVGVGVGYN
ncbi:UNVERIFIED_CONTAM: hypothetical protein FKN15_043182 [Acipenser sinensis]